MFRHWRVTLSVAIALTVLLCIVSTSLAAVTLTADPIDRFGVSPTVFTIDPFNPPSTGTAQRGVIGTRHLRQSFKNPTTMNVGEINISFDVSLGGPPYGGVNDTGLKFAIFQVDDVNAGSWAAGALVREITIPMGTLPATTQILRLSLTGGDVFPLPARFDGTTGYGIELSTPNADAADGNPGVMIYTTANFYDDGRQYSESGASNTRDVGVSMLPSLETPCDPGDVNCDTTVDTVDLGFIAANFRTSGEHDDGDLTGDGFIDFDDFHQWKQNYPGAFPGSGGGEFSNVPEPTSGLFVALALVAIGSFSRLRRRVM
jgi:hypothetical protein